MESENGRIIGPEYEDVNWQYISGGRKTEYLEETANEGSKQYMRCCLHI